VIDPTSLTQFETETFDWIKYSVHERIPGFFLKDFRLTQDNQAYFEDHFVARITGTVLGQSLPGGVYRTSATAKFEYPASPWQHFKRNHSRAWWLRWLVKRRPVQTAKAYRTARVEFDYEHNVVFPMQRSYRPSLGRAVYIPTINARFDDWGPVE
jgi:hypothetical protein